MNRSSTSPRSPFLVLLALALALVACGGSGGDADGEGSGADGSVTDDPCESGETRCDGSSYQICGDGDTFVESESCGGGDVCDDTLGCVECRPESVSACSGDAVYACNDDGTLGDPIEVCEAGQCNDGRCGGGGGGDGCSAAAELVYVVDIDHRLLSFDPAKLAGGGDPFTLIGTLSCPAGGLATPFSMSVDRDGTAWVLYSNGQLFAVSTTDASCEATGFVPGQQGFETFGMGFVSDAPGSDEETLFIAGGSAAMDTIGSLGSLDTSTLTVTKIGTLPNTEYSPELTGTGDAKLYGYFPGTVTDSLVAELDKSSVAMGESWSLGSSSGQVTAWAFAHWGGHFYVFVTTGDIFGSTSQVLELDPMTGDSAPAVSSSPYTVVGAGVSTCAPIVIE